jgi:FkbM family methyltransferase
MTFISYSQNFEDVLLWRALGKVQGGFYIDVGANDPELHSVTKAFYDAGWSGINIEPMPSYALPFVEQRPRDINLNCAAGSASGEIVLYEVPSMNGWASTDPEVAAAHRADGYEVVENRVPLRTLADICAEHVKGEIHFLKIDVEGFEGEVLKGMDLQRWRPWVLVIEATLPGSRETNHEQWEGLVTPHGYQFVWFDGLNRYYVAQEHAELAAHFGIQPNVFDAFISYHLDRAWADNRKLAERVSEHWQRVEELDARLAAFHQTARENAARHRAEVLQVQAHLRASESRAQALEAQLHKADAWGRDMEQQLVAVLNSNSWKITRPLRAVMARGEHSLANRIRRKAKALVGKGLRWLTQRELLRRLLLPVIGMSPWLQRRVSRFLVTARIATSEVSPYAANVPAQQRDMPQSARSVLADLQRAYEKSAK